MNKSRKSQESKPSRGSGARVRAGTPGAAAPAKKGSGSGDRRGSRVAAPRYLLTKVPPSSEEPGALTLRRTGSAEDSPATRRSRAEKLPGTLCELLARARAKHDAGVPQASIVHWVYDVAHKLEIRVRHDEYVRREAGARRPAARIEPDPKPSEEKASHSSSVQPESAPPILVGGDDRPGDTEPGTDAEEKINPGKLEDTGAPDCGAAPTMDGHEPSGRVHEPDSGPLGPISADGHDLAPHPDGRRDADESPPTGGKDAAASRADEADSAPPDDKPQPEANQRSISPPSRPVTKKGHAVPAPMTVNRGERRLNLYALLNPNAESPPLDVDDNKTMVGRLILSSARRSAKTAVRLCSESSGVVIDARTWRVLSLPPRAFCSQPATKDLDRMLGDGLYDIIPVDDGTVLTLYAWDHPVEGHVWCLASSNGYDVSSLKWMGPLTYAEVFADLANRLYPDFVKASGMSLVVPPGGGTTRLAFKTLDTSKCYTIGLRHHNFHPLREDPERMWQIQHAILGDDSPILCYGVGGLPGIPLQKKFTSCPRTVAELLQRTHGALERAKAQIAAQHRKSNENPTHGDAPERTNEANLRAQKTETPTTGEVPSNKGADLPQLCYGFILRSTDVSRTGSQSDVLVESDLLKIVRRLAYDKAPRQFRDQLTCLTRLEYNAIRASLTPEDRKTFLALFPAWKARFHAYDTFIRNVIKQTIHHLRVKSMLLEAPKASPASTKTELIAQEMAAHILHSDPVQPFSQDVDKVVADYVMDPRYTSWYLLALSAPTPDAPASQ